MKKNLGEALDWLRKPVETEEKYGLVALKPDTLRRGNREEVYGRLRREGFSIEGVKTHEMSGEDVGRQYSHVPDKVAPEVVWGIHEYLEDEEVEAAIVSREVPVLSDKNISDFLEEVIGDHPHPEKNKPGTIRHGAVDEESPFYAGREEIELYIKRRVARKGGEGVRNMVHFAEEDEPVDEEGFENELERDLDIYFREEIERFQEGEGDDTSLDETVEQIKEMLDPPSV